MLSRLSRRSLDNPIQLSLLIVVVHSIPHRKIHNWKCVWWFMLHIIVTSVDDDEKNYYICHAVTLWRREKENFSFMISLFLKYSLDNFYEWIFVCTTLSNEWVCYWFDDTSDSNLFKFHAWADERNFLRNIFTSAIVVRNLRNVARQSCVIFSHHS